MIKFTTPRGCKVGIEDAIAQWIQWKKGCYFSSHGIGLHLIYMNKCSSSLSIVYHNGTKKDGSVDSPVQTA